jgi:plastocyanin
MWTGSWSTASETRACAPRPFAAASIACLLIAAGTATVSGGTVTGLVRTRAQPGVPPATAIVYAEPLDVAAPQRPTLVSLAQKGKVFHPRTLVVPVGSTVAFPNEDLIFHNVFSLSGPQPFDLGLYRGGASRAHTFTQPATYRVFCNIHPRMSAFVVVVPTPYATATDGDGRFVLDLPPGRYRLTAISERAGPVRATATSVAGAVMAPELALDESGWTPVPHKNKHGQDYAAESYRR